MIRYFLLVAVAGAAVALAAPHLASSRNDRATDLERRVAQLENQVKILRAGARSQTGVNRTQIRLNDLIGRRIDVTNARIDNVLDQIDTLRDRQPNVSVELGSLQFLSPRASVTSNAYCTSGEPVGGGFWSTTSVEGSGSAPETGGWQAWAYFPYAAGTGTFRAYVVCLS
jgi:hypothetical protein